MGRQELMTIGDGRNIEEPINQELFLAAQLSLPQQFGTAPTLPQTLPVHLLLYPHVSHEQDPKILEHSCMWQSASLVKSKELIHHYMARSKTTLLFLNLKCNDWPKAPFQHRRVNFPRES